MVPTLPGGVTQNTQVAHWRVGRFLRQTAGKSGPLTSAQVQAQLITAAGVDRSRQRSAVQAEVQNLAVLLNLSGVLRQLCEDKLNCSEQTKC